jgi:hypothetical protein
MTPVVNMLGAVSRSNHPLHPAAIRWLEESLAARALGQLLAVPPFWPAARLW